MKNANPRQREQVSPISQILIVCDDDSVAAKTKNILRAANFRSERAKTMGAACQCIRLDGFDAVFTVPLLRDGAWQQLLEFARCRDMGLPFVVMACTFDMRDWGDSMKSGAFDVLDLVEELPRAAEVARLACSTANSSESARDDSFRPNLRKRHDVSEFSDHDAPLRAREKENRT
jgi:DNA-binding NtrC family response regulator